MALATTVNLTPTAAEPTATPAPATGKQAVVFANDGGSPTVNFSATDPVMVGDTGAGGLAGNVPAPAAGTAAAGKFLKADGSWAIPAGAFLMALVALAPSAGGNFTVAHGLSWTPAAVLFMPTSGGAVWCQSTFADATNLYLTASDGGVTGFAVCFS